MISPYNYRNCIQGSTQLAEDPVNLNETATSNTTICIVSLQLQYIELSKSLKRRLTPFASDSELAQGFSQIMSTLFGAG